MENPFQIFTSPIFGNVRVALYDDVAWFVGNDVCRALGYARPDMAIKRYVAEEDKAYALVATSLCMKEEEPISSHALPCNLNNREGVRRKMVIINESGLYSLVLSANTPEAQKFKRWVTAEVLPAIRATGSYELLERQALPIPPLPPAVESVKLKRPRRLPSKMACAYAFDMSDDTVKIGHTGDIEDRKTRVEKKYGLEVKDEHHTPPMKRPDARRIEKTMHKKYAHVKVKGEFFNADFREVSEELDRLSSVETDYYEEEITCEFSDYDRVRLAIDLINVSPENCKERLTHAAANLLFGRKIF